MAPQSSSIWRVVGRSVRKRGTSLADRNAINPQSPILLADLFREGFDKGSIVGNYHTFVTNYSDGGEILSLRPWTF